MESKGNVCKSFHLQSHHLLRVPAYNEGLSHICKCPALMQTAKQRWMLKAMSQDNKLFHLLLANLKLSPFNLLWNFPYKIALAPEQSLLLKWLFNSSS